MTRVGNARTTIVAVSFSVLLLMVVVVVRGASLEERWGRVAEVLEGGWQQVETWFVYDLRGLHAKDLVVENVSYMWNLLKPGGAWHPKQFLEQYHGHLVLEAVLIIIIVKFMLQGSSYSGQE